MRRAICVRKHRFRIHSDDVNERVYGSLFRTVVSRILYAYFETSDLVSSLVYGHDACLPACLPLSPPIRFLAFSISFSRENTFHGFFPRRLFRSSFVSVNIRQNWI